jgi:predicted acetyltransferase
MSKIELIKANLSDYPIIQNMARFYVYEMSRYCGLNEAGWALPPDGLYECDDFKNYFIEDDRYPFVIKAANELAGFVLINKIGSTNEVDWNIGEFFVMARFQNKGIAKEAAIQIFNKFEGNWEVAVMPDNLGALKFWQKVVSQYCKDKYNQEQKIVDYPEPHPMIILSFESK